MIVGNHCGYSLFCIFVIEYIILEILGLAMSLIDLQEDNIRANEEIQNICDLFANDPNVIVFPIHGCSTTVLSFNVVEVE